VIAARRGVQVLGLLVAAVLAACVHANPGPTVVLKFAPDSNAADQKSISDASAVWVKIGFLYAADSALPECTRTWYKPSPPTTTQRKCKITVGITRASMTKMFGEDSGIGAVTDRDQRSIIIDPKWHDFELIEIAAHEFGHLLLDCGHLPAGQSGVMQAKGASFTPTAADYALACSTLGICVSAGP
jgi:hypothetical protein